MAGDTRQTASGAPARAEPPGPDGSHGVGGVPRHTRGARLEAALRLQMERNDQSAPDTWLDSHHPALAVHAARIPEGVVVTLRNSDELLNDPLTGLPNRRGFDRELGALLDQPASWPISVLFIDLDRFKVVNDSLGHRARNTLDGGGVQAPVRGGGAAGPRGPTRQRQVRRRLPQHGHPRDDADLRARPRRVPAPVHHRRPHAVDHRQHRGSGCDGDVDDGHDPPRRRRPEHAYRARGTGSYTFVQPGHHVDALHRLEVEDGLRDAIRADDIVLHWQPAFDLHTGEVAGVEGLARWYHPVRGLLQPGAFVPSPRRPTSSSSSGATPSSPVSARPSPGAPSWVVRAPTSARSGSTSRLESSSTRRSPTRSLRSSMRSGSRPPISAWRSRRRRCSRVPFKPIDNLERLSALGVRLALDDFGTGHS